MKAQKSFWYPFRSPVVAEICAHLSDDERSALKKISRASVFTMGLIGALIYQALFLGGRAAFPETGVWTVALGAAIALQPCAWLASVPLIAKRKRFFASTAYARHRGITAEAIKLHAFRKP